MIVKYLTYKYYKLEMSDQLINLLQTSLFLQYQGDNNIYTTLFMIISMYFFNYMNIASPLLIDRIINKFKKRNLKAEYVIEGRVSSSAEYCYHITYFPVEFRAVMYQLYKLKAIKYGKQFNITNRYGEEKDNKTNILSYSLNSNDILSLGDGIYIKQLNTENKSNDLKSITEKYSLYIYSYKLSFEELVKKIDLWTKEYRKFIKDFNDGNYYYFSYLDSDKTKDGVFDIKFESYTFNTNKIFDNIFFEQKELLINRLNNFIDNEDRYKRLGIPHTFGLLFYGKPGCGKTSCIKAISNYTKRHIVEIPLSKIKTCSELKKIFFNDTINEYHVPADKKIIVLEDIDCMGDIVNKRSFQKNNNKCNDCKDNEICKKCKLDTEKLADKNASHIYEKIFKSTMPIPNENNNDKLTLSYLLNLIDGVLEQPGRILIITSNYPEKLDEALIRPGRIDLKIEFKYCNHNICKQIIEFFFQEPIQPNIIFPDYKWSPADVFQKCFNFNDINKVCTSLVEENNNNIL